MNPIESMLLDKILGVIIAHLGLKNVTVAQARAVIDKVQADPESSRLEKISPAEVQAIISAVCAVAKILDNDICPLINPGG